MTLQNNKAQSLLLEASLSDLEGLGSDSALLQLQVGTLLANLFIPACLVRGGDWTISDNYVRSQQLWKSFTGRFGTHERSLCV